MATSPTKAKLLDPAQQIVGVQWPSPWKYILIRTAIHCSNPFANIVGYGSFSGIGEPENMSLYHAFGYFGGPLEVLGYGGPPDAEEYLSSNYTVQNWDIVDFLGEDGNSRVPSTFNLGNPAHQSNLSVSAPSPSASAALGFSYPFGEGFGNPYYEWAPHGSPVITLDDGSVFYGTAVLNGIGNQNLSRLGEFNPIYPRDVEGQGARSVEKDSPSIFITLFELDMMPTNVTLHFDATETQPAKDIEFTVIGAFTRQRWFTFTLAVSYDDPYKAYVVEVLCERNDVGDD